MSVRLSRCAQTLLLALALIAEAGLAIAAGNPRTGEQIAERWCTACHAAQASGSDAAPPFTEIARRPGRSSDFFYVWLTDPHPPMPRLDLSRQDIADLIAYLISLAPPR